MSHKHDVILDTHVAIWLLNGDNTLSSESREILQSVCKSNFLLLSAISIWEIAMLQSKKKISLTQPMHTWIGRVKALPFVKIIAIDEHIAIESCKLPGEFHGDPADRMIVATSRILDAPLMTRDRKITEYGYQHFVRIISC